MNPPMTYSGAGMALTEQSEGCRLVAYQDQGGRWTNGYGNTHGVVPGGTITQEQAVDDLHRNIQTSVNDVNQLVTVQLTQGEFDALVDFDFNIGRGNFASSTMLHLLNLGEFNSAAREFAKWDHCGGVVVAGLLKRRELEQQLFGVVTP